MTKSWLKPLYAMQLNIWMFNVTNVDGILKRHEKPNLHEIGPFVFEYGICTRNFIEYQKKNHRIRNFLGNFFRI